METKFPPGQDMENISPKDLEEAKQYTKERKAYKDASQLGSEPKPTPKPTPKVDRALRVNEMGDAYKSGGKVSSASSRADGCCIRGKTRGTMITMKNGGMC